jgi:pimeloyl-ACP methyl ester carboxylesterase
MLAAWAHVEVSGGSMKVSLFEQVPYRYIPEDFGDHHSSVVTAPYDVVDPGLMHESVFSAYAELMHGVRAGFDGIVVTEGCTTKFARPIADHGLRRRLHRIAVPTLIAWGRQDALIPVSYAQELASGIAQPGRGHR